jgi:putative FmdB family regulatory protein
MINMYEYKCRICGLEFTEYQPLGARDIASCPECSCISDKKLSKVNFTFGFTLADECRYVKGTRDYFVRNV